MDILCSICVDRLLFFTRNRPSLSFFVLSWIGPRQTLDRSTRAVGGDRPTVSPVRPPCPRAAAGRFDRAPARRRRRGVPGASPGASLGAPAAGRRGPRRTGGPSGLRPACRARRPRRTAADPSAACVAVPPRRGRPPPARAPGSSAAEYGLAAARAGRGAHAASLRGCTGRRNGTDRRRRPTEGASRAHTGPRRPFPRGPPRPWCGPGRCAAVLSPAGRPAGRAAARRRDRGWTGR